jgi:hypothetical protein
MDMRLSLSTTRRSFFTSPAMFTASSAIPAPMPASPMTTTVRLPEAWSASPQASPSPVESAVPAWPVV